MAYRELIEQNFSDSLKAISDSLDGIAPSLEAAIESAIRSYENGGTLFFAGNGGSAADACHIASELVGSFENYSAPLPAISLATDVAILTSVANDYSFENIFLQQAKALARPGDQIWLISTSGESANVLEVAKWARDAGIATVGLLGKGGGTMASQVDIPIVVTGENPQRIQEVHILVLHTLASALKRKFPNGITLPVKRDKFAAT